MVVRRSKRPSRTSPVEARAWLQRCYGGCPSITGRKHVYPASHHTARWTSLACKALDWQRNRTWCLRNKVPLPPRNAQFEYVLFHGRPEQIQRRGTRNSHRAILQAPPGTEVHHRNQKTLALRSAIVVSRRKHDEIHAEIAEDEKKVAAVARRSAKKKAVAGKAATGKAATGKAATGKAVASKAARKKTGKKRSNKNA